MKIMTRVFGITGTNGKTTTACMLKEILEKVEYAKLRAGDRSGKGKDDFELILYPKLPKS